MVIRMHSVEISGELENNVNVKGVGVKGADYELQVGHQHGGVEDGHIMGQGRKSLCWQG